MTKEVKYKITAENKTSKGIKAARKGLNSLGKAGGVAGLAFGASVIAGYASASQEIDKLAKSSAMLNIPAKELQILNHQANLTGSSVGVLEKGLKKMALNVSDAAAGTGTATKALEKLNIDAAQLNTLRPDEQIRAIADAMEGVANSNDKIELADSIFGGKGVELINTMKGGSAAINAAGAEMEKYGLLLSELDTRKVEIANDQMERSKQVFKGVSNQIAIQFAPMVNELTNRFLGLASETGGVDGLVRKMIGWGVKGFGILANAVHVIKIGFVGLQAGAASFIEQLLRIPQAINGMGGKFADMMGFDTAQFEKNDAMIESFKLTAADLRQKFQDVLLEKVPSEKVQEYMDDLNAKFDEQAQTLVRDQGLDSNPVVMAKVEELTALETLEGQYKQKALKQEQDFQFKIQQFQRASTKGKIKTLISEGVQMTQGAANTNKRLFKINKALALADAAVTLPSAVMKAISRGGGLPWGAVFGALTLANGLAQINAIKSASYGGGGGTSASLAGSGGGAAAVRSVDTSGLTDTGGASSSSVSPQAQTQIIVNGDIFGVEDFEEKILNTLAEASGNNRIRIDDTAGRTLIERT